LRKNVVKSITIDAAKQQITYRDSSGHVIKATDAHIPEGTSVDLQVEDYNPLAQTVTVNPIQAVVNYQSPSPLISSFFPVPAANPTGAMGAEEPQNVTDITKVVPCDKDPVYKAVLNYQDLDGTLNNNLTLFKSFYNSLSFLNNQYGSFKQYSSLTPAYVCPYIKAFNDDIQPYLAVPGTINSSGVSPIPVGYPATQNGCDATSISEQMQMADIQYKQYFTDAATKLNAIQSAITRALAGTTMSNYVKKHFASCTGDPVVAEMTTISNDIDKEVTSTQAFNTLYSGQYDKDITTDIAEYNTLFMLQYRFKQANNLVQNTDEFKATVAVTSTVTPVNSYTFNVNLPVTRFVKIDFSAGAFFSTLSNESSQLKQKGATVDSFMVAKYKTNNYTVGPMGFINFHSQVPGSVQWGLYVGSGLAFNQSTQIVLSGGGELLLGKSQRVILHVGAALSQVNRVNSLYPDGSYFANAAYTPTTLQKWDSKFMFGVSWNLSKSQ
jgi:hypothetical protein